MNESSLNSESEKLQRSKESSSSVFVLDLIVYDQLWRFYSEFMHKNRILN